MKSLRSVLIRVVVGILAAIVLSGAPAHAQSVGLPGAGGEGADSSEAALQLADLEGQLARVQERLAEWRLQADGFEQIAAAAPARLIEIEDELTSIEEHEHRKNKLGFQKRR